MDTGFPNIMSCGHPETECLWNMDMGNSLVKSCRLCVNQVLENPMDFDFNKNIEEMLQPLHKTRSSEYHKGYDAGVKAGSEAANRQFVIKLKRIIDDLT